MPFAKYIQVNDDGDIVAQKISKRNPGEGWRKLSKSEINKIARGPKKFRVDMPDEKRRGKGRGRIKERDFIKVECAGTRFPADGKTVMSVCVRGAALTESTTVKLLVNGHPYTATKKRHLEIVTDEPGLYTVSLVDKRFWTHRPNQTVVAYEPEAEEEESNG